MKYIRTKDGIFLKEQNTPVGVAYLECYCDKDGNITKIDTSEEQYKEADTIEELCHTFVFDDGDDEPTICGTYNELVYWFNYSKKQQYKIRNCYGVIWTDKGLIFVAKMNDKGELELI